MRKYLSICGLLIICMFLCSCSSNNGMKNETKSTPTATPTVAITPTITPTLTPEEVVNSVLDKDLTLNDTYKFVKKVVKKKYKKHVKTEQDKYDDSCGTFTASAYIKEKGKNNYIELNPRIVFCKTQEHKATSYVFVNMEYVSADYLDTFFEENVTFLSENGRCSFECHHVDVDLDGELNKTSFNFVFCADDDNTTYSIKELLEFYKVINGKNLTMRVIGGEDQHTYKISHKKIKTVIRQINLYFDIMKEIQKSR